MPFSEFEIRKIEKTLTAFIDTQGPAKHLHDKVNWEYELDAKSQAVELVSVRPYYMDPTEKIRSPFARAKYVKSRDLWKIYWMRQTRKWCLYEPHPETDTLENFLAIIKKDAYACFLG